MGKRKGETAKSMALQDKEPKGLLPGSGPWIEAFVARHLHEAYNKLDAFVRRDEPRAYVYTGEDAHQAARAARDVQAILHVLYESFEGVDTRTGLRSKWSAMARIALAQDGRNLDDVYGGPTFHAKWVADLIDSGALPAPTPTARAIGMPEGTSTPC